MGLSDDQIRADILNRLMRRKCWGGRYLPAQTLIGWIGRKIVRNGHKVRMAIRDLINAGLLISHKGGSTISLNPSRRVDIHAFIDAHLA
jgi:hypothetical protein